MVGRVRKWAFGTQEKSLSDQDLESTDRLPTFTRFGPCDLGTQPRKARSMASRQEAVSRESSSVFVRIWCVDPRPVIRRAPRADPFSPSPRRPWSRSGHRADSRPASLWDGTKYEYATPIVAAYPCSQGVSLLVYGVHTDAGGWSKVKPKWESSSARRVGVAAGSERHT